MEIPNWLNDKYFAELLPNISEHFVSLETFEITSEKSTTADEIIVLRVLLTYKATDGSSKKRSLLLKTSFEIKNVEKSNMLQKLMQKEVNFRENLLLQLEEIFKTHAALVIQFSPHFIYKTESNDGIVLVLEDPAAYDYERHVFKDMFALNYEDFIIDYGLDWSPMRAALKKLAEFHAASIVKREKYGAYEAEYQLKPLTEKTQRSFVERNVQIFETFKEAIKKLGFAGEYINKLPSKEKFIAALLRLHVIADDALKVLNLGNCSRKNIYFQHGKNGEVVDALFMDFQHCKYAPPTYDLFHLIFTSADTYLKTEKFYSLLFIYERHLKAQISLLKCQNSYRAKCEISRDMLKRDRFYIFYIIIAQLPYILKSHDERTTLVASEEDPSLLQIMLYPTYAYEIKALLPWLCNNGLDILVFFEYE